MPGKRSTTASSTRSLTPSSARTSNHESMRENHLAVGFARLWCGDDGRLQRGENRSALADGSKSGRRQIVGRRRLKEDAWIRRQRPRNYCASALAPEQVPALAESADRHRAAPSCSLRALNLKSFPALPPVLLPPVFLAHALIGMTEAWASFVDAPGGKMLRMPRRNISDGVASS